MRQLRLWVLGTGVTLTGIISDTHGLLREQAIAALGCELIIHAGDLGILGCGTSWKR